MTRKTIGNDDGFMWKNESIVYVVSYISKKQSKNEKIVTVFNNLAEAKKFYAHCLRRHESVQIDTCRVYDSYTSKQVIKKELEAEKKCSGEYGE